MNKDRLVIRRGGTAKNYWRDTWKYRELFLILAWRDVTVRYKQTLFGIAWAILRPFVTMVVFTIVFGKLAGMPSDGRIPYPLLVFAGMLPWYLFSSALTGTGDSMVSNANLIGKVYFPRLIIPVASIVTALVDFLIGLGLLLATMLWYGLAPGWQILLLPFFVLWAVVVSLGPGLWVAVLNLKYRDFRMALPFLVQFSLYICPVGFSSAVVPQEWRFVYGLNPLVGVIDGFRWCVLGDDSKLYWPSLAMSILVGLCLLWFGLGTFRRNEKQFADLI